MKLQPLFDRVVLKKIDLKMETSSGILLTSSFEKNTSVGLVVACGPGKYEAGELVPMYVSEQDKVIYEASKAEVVSLENEEFVIVRQDDIMAILK